MSQIPLQLIPERKIYTVSELSAAIKARLERDFPDVWVSGEVSNFRGASSGHLYFTLKDATAQLRAVCFRNQARYLKFKPADGLSVIARGRLSVYEARGEYQLAVEYLEPAGVGALQLAFEQLKRKLAAEGLFDPARKKPLPVLPRAVGLVTSPHGAAVRDIIRVLKRRFGNMDIFLYPVKVQGDGAPEEIAEGIRYFNQRRLADALIVGRGGGSLEDLWAFNEEMVARAIAASKIPIISAVGHETDFTIADFAADLRAPTPSAAAELVVHRKQDFIEELGNRRRHAMKALELRLSQAHNRLTSLEMHRAFQTLTQRLQERGQRVDDALLRMERAAQKKLQHRRRAWQAAAMRLVRYDPRQLIELSAVRLAERRARLEKTLSEALQHLQQRLSACREAWLERGGSISRFDFRQFLQLKSAGLERGVTSLDQGLGKFLSGRAHRLAQVEPLLAERSPLTVLGRGYSITRDARGRIVREAAQVEIGDDISVRLARGELGATVRDKEL